MLAGCGGGSTSKSAIPIRYVFKDVTPPGIQAAVAYLNNKGQVLVNAVQNVGPSAVVDSQLYSNGSFIDLNKVDPIGHTQGLVINNNGVVLYNNGAISGNPGGIGTALYDAGTVTQLPTLDSSSNTNIDLSSSGNVLAVVLTGSTQIYKEYRDGAWADVVAPSGITEYRPIGYSAAGDLIAEADGRIVVRHNGASIDYGTPPTLGYITAIVGPTGELVGDVLETNGTVLPYESRPNGSAQPLTTSSSVTYVMGVNASGLILGETQPSGRVILWENRQPHDITDSLGLPTGWIAVETSKINDAGQISGTVVLSDRTSHAFVSTPAD